MQPRDACGPALLAVLALLLSMACVVPLRSAPGVQGRVVDRASGEPLADAILVVRFDGRHGDQLPDRELLGHAEAVTGPDGSFTIPGYRRAGPAVWPLYETEARVVSVLRSGYRCPDPLVVTGSRQVVVEMERALDVSDRQASCHPVASRRGEAEQYRTAWRQLYPARETAQERDERRQLGRALEARTALGFGENCEGPVVDLALAPGGERVAFVVARPGGAVVGLAEVTPQGTRPAESVGSAADTPPRRLAWTRPGELVLWSPASPQQRSIAASIFAPGRSDMIWSNSRALPAALDHGAATSRNRAPLDPADLSDEGDTLWLGRTFSLERSLEPDTGLARDRLRVRREDGSSLSTALPGEACGGPNFGRPHYRIGVGGRLGFDLRFVEGGCHALAIDLETGAWTRLDHSPLAAQCRAQRSLPPSQLTTALRGWTRELHDAMQAQGIDPGAAYALHIGSGGQTRVVGRTQDGETATTEAPRFPIETPLRRIDVTNVAPRPDARARDLSPAAMAPL